MARCIVDGGPETPWGRPQVTREIHLLTAERNRLVRLCWALICHAGIDPTTLQSIGRSIPNPDSDMPEYSRHQILTLVGGDDYHGDPT